MGLPIKIGVSSCLLGERVRYDGNHKLDHYIVDVLGRVLTLYGVCPETGAGMPVPREAMRLQGDPASPRLVTIHGQVDLTAQMLQWCEGIMPQLEKEDLDGFIFRRNSPSSGLFRVKVYHDGAYTAEGKGLFAAAVVHHFPLMPVEEDGRLKDRAIAANFVERVYAYHRLKDMLRACRSIRDLISFHTDHKLQLMSHAPSLYRKLGRLVARGKASLKEGLLDEYARLFMTAMSAHATVATNTDVLMHMAGYFRKELSLPEKAELQSVIARYQQGLVPLIVPFTLFGHYINHYGKDYLKRQHYLKPFPDELNASGIV